MSQIVVLTFFAMIENTVFFQSDGIVSLSQIFITKSCIAQYVTDSSMSAFHIFHFSLLFRSMPGTSSFCFLFRFLLTSSLIVGSRLIFTAVSSSFPTDSTTGISQVMFNTSLCKLEKFKMMRLKVPKHHEQEASAKICGS